MVETETASAWAACVMCGVLCSPRWRLSTVGQGRRWERETCWWSWNNHPQLSCDRSARRRLHFCLGPLQEGPRWLLARPMWSFSIVVLHHGGSQQSSLPWCLTRAELYQLCLCLCHPSASFTRFGRRNFNFNPTLFLCSCACDFFFFFSLISFWLSDNLL